MATPRSAPRLAVLCLCALVANAARADALDEQFLAGLRARHLFELAEKYCRDRLAREDLPDAVRAELTVELARGLVQRALESPPPRDALWEQALAATDDFARQHPRNPRRLLVLAQRGLVLLAWGELLRQESELNAGDAQRLALARDKLRAAIEAIERAIEATAEQVRRQQLGRKPASGELGADELRGLARQLNYQLARALRNQGESYPADSPDRVNSLSQAAERLGPLAQLDPADPLAWPARLDEVACLRLMGHFDAAERKLALLDAQSSTPALRQRALAERVLLSIDRQRLDDALAALDAGRAAGDAAPPELDYAALGAYLAAWQRSADGGDRASAGRWQTRAADVVRAIDQSHGPYWSRRAESLFAQRVAGASGPADAAVLVRAAEGFYRAGQVDEALAAYDRAIEQLRAAGEKARAFDLAYTAAAIEQQRGRNGPAAERFRRLAIDERSAPQAPAAHLLAIYNRGQELKVGDDQPLSDYEQLLREHLDTWPQSGTADQVRVWWGRVLERSERWQEAIENYAAVRAESAVAGAALEALQRCYAAWLARLRGAGQPTAPAAQAAVDALARVAGRPTAAGKPWTAMQLRTALAAARFLLDYDPTGHARAERLLTEATAGGADAPAEWKSAAAALWIRALAAQGRGEEAQARLAELAGSEPDALLAVVESLGRMTDTAEGAARTKLAALALAVIETLDDRRGQLTADQGLALDVARGRAMAAAGRADEGLALLAKLAAEHSSDGGAQEAHARALFDAARPAAAEAWQHVERKSRPGSPRWLRAKYYQALIYERRGDRKRAAQTVKLAAALYPDLGGGEQQQKLLEVLRRCQ